MCIRTQRTPVSLSLSLSLFLSLSLSLSLSLYGFISISYLIFRDARGVASPEAEDRRGVEVAEVRQRHLAARALGPFRDSEIGCHRRSC